MTDQTLKNRFVGCLLGLALGDALGANFEGQDADAVLERFATPEELINYPSREMWYTDDTQMTIGVCEALVENGLSRQWNRGFAFRAGGDCQLRTDARVV